LFFDKVKSLGVDSCLYEISKNDWPLAMIGYKTVATSYVPRCVALLLPHRNAGRLHLEKAESIQLCAFRVGQARTTGAEAQFWLRQPWRNLPLFLFPILSPTSDFPLFNEGLEISRRENCGIKDVCR